MSASAVQVQIQLDTGEEALGQATLTRPSDGGRLGKAVGIFLVGAALCAAAFILPGPHLLVTTPVFLGAGAIGAYWVLKAKVILGDVQATCPACGEAGAFEGGTLEDPMQSACPSCSRPVRLTIQEA